MAKQITAFVIGAGNRGQNYAFYAKDCPDKLKVVGIADPRTFRRDKIQREHKISQEHVYEDWRAAAEKDKFADCVFVCTPDQQHKDPAIAFANKGYHVLLEKPMAVTQADCEAIVEACRKNNVMLAVCHVLRYTPQAIKIREIIDSGAIGEVANIQLLEPVGHWHFAHSFVRGNWSKSDHSCFILLANSHDLDLIAYLSSGKKCRAISSFGSLKHFTKANKVGHWHFAHSFVRGNWSKSDHSCFILLAKSCHDLDLIAYWSSGKKCTAISSFGSLKHFTKANKPIGAASRCLDCSVEKTCPYSAKRIYLDPVKMGHTSWPVSVITDVPDIESVTEALKTGPYGKCVYESDNNVCDNQVVNIQFDDGSTASFSMVAFTQKICERQVKVFGSKGEINCDFSRMEVIQYDFAHEDIFVHDLTKVPKAETAKYYGHGGADYYAITAFVEAVSTNDPSKILTGADESLDSHILCFKAEQSRLENSVIQVNPAAK